MRSLNLHQACDSFLFKSPREASTTRPLRLSAAMVVPTVLLTTVFPTLRLVKTAGALISYHYLRVKGSTTFFFPPFLETAEDPALAFFTLPTAILLIRSPM